MRGWAAVAMSCVLALSESGAAPKSAPPSPCDGSPYENVGLKWAVSVSLESMMVLHVRRVVCRVPSWPIRGIGLEWREPFRLVMKNRLGTALVLTHDDRGVDRWFSDDEPYVDASFEVARPASVEVTLPYEVNFEWPVVIHEKAVPGFHGETDDFTTMSGSTWMRLDGRAPDTHS